MSKQGQYLLAFVISAVIVIVVIAIAGEQLREVFNTMGKPF